MITTTPSGKLTVEDSIILEEAVQTLPDHQRAILALVTSGYYYKEIAKILNITRNSVSANLGKAHSLIEMNLSIL